MKYARTIRRTWSIPCPRGVPLRTECDDSVAKHRAEQRDFISVQFISCDWGWKCRNYMPFEKFLLKNEQFRPLLERFSEEARAWRSFGILHLNRHVLYGAVEVDMMLMIKILVCFINSPTNTSQLHTASFYKAMKLVVTVLRELYKRNS